MGVFRLTNETNNQKPVWATSDQKLFYNNRKLYCDDDNCVNTHNNIAGGIWLIGPDPESNSGGVASAAAADLLPHQVSEWKYVSGGKLQSDPQLMVTGKLISM